MAQQILELIVFLTLTLITDVLSSECNICSQFPMLLVLWRYQTLICFIAYADILPDPNPP